MEVIFTSLLLLSGMVFILVVAKKLKTTLYQVEQNLWSHHLRNGATHVFQFINPLE